MIKDLTTTSGKQVTLYDVFDITPDQHEQLLLASADVLIRSGMIREGAALNGPSMLQHLEELGSHLEAQRTSAAAETSKPEIVDPSKYASEPAPGLERKVFFLFAMMAEVVSGKSSGQRFAPEVLGADHDEVDAALKSLADKKLISVNRLN